jgi:acetyl esterase
MALDPQARALLDQMAEAGAKPFEAMSVAEARQSAYAFKDLGGPPEDVAAVDHVYIPGPTADLPARIYHPAGAGDGPLPAMLYFHGSGWVVLNIDICDPFSRAYANRAGCVVVAVNYQKAPEHKFPIPFDDCFAATEWVFANADALGVDPSRIGVSGDSAGGNLAAAVALKARDRGGPDLRCQVLVYPAVDYGWDTPSALANAEGYMLQRGSMEWFWNHYVTSPTDAENPYCSPLRAASHTGLPPALVVGAEFDPLCDDARGYVAKLEAAGVPVKYSEYKGMIHGFLWMSAVLDQSRAVVDEVAGAVRTYLG